MIMGYQYRLKKYPSCAILVLFFTLYRDLTLLASRSQWDFVIKEGIKHHTYDESSYFNGTVTGYLHTETCQSSDFQHRAQS